MKYYTAVSAVLFVLVALAHLVRVFFDWQVTVDSMVVPQWISVVALLITLALVAWAVKLLRSGSG